MRVVKWYVEGIDKINVWLSRWLKYLMLIICGIVVYEVITRFVFDSPTNWTILTSAYLFGTYMILAGGYLLGKGQHVKVELITERLSKRTQLILQLISYLFALLFSSVLVYFSILGVIDSIRSHEHPIGGFQPPLYPLRMILTLGAVLLLLQVVAQIIKRIDTLTKIKAVDSEIA